MDGVSNEIKLDIEVCIKVTAAMLEIAEQASVSEYINVIENLVSRNVTLFKVINVKRNSWCCRI